MSGEAGVRLNKALAAAGVCSRRKADELISAGRVAINGETVATPGVSVIPGRDRVTLDGRGIPLTGAGVEHAYVALHKPVQVVSTVSDPEGRPTVMELLPQSLRQKRLYPVGRLDYFSEGLLLLTDDGELTHRLTHPRYHLPRTYEVRLRERPSPEALRLMRLGMTLAEGERLAPVEAVPFAADPHWLTLVLHQGVNRQIRRMCRDLNLTILTLRRVGMGPVSLDHLPKGACRPLSPAEIAALRRAVGL